MTQAKLIGTLILFKIKEIKSHFKVQNLSIKAGTESDLEKMGAQTISTLLGAVTQAIHPTWPDCQGCCHHEQVLG